VVVFYNFLPFPSPRGEHPSEEKERNRSGNERDGIIPAYFDIAAGDQRDLFALRPRFTIEPGNRGGR